MLVFPNSVISAPSLVIPLEHWMATKIEWMNGRNITERIAVIPSSHYKHLKIIFNLSLLRGSKTVSARQNRTNPLNKKPKSCNFLLFLCSFNINKTNWKRLLFPYPNLFSCGLIAFFNKYNMCVVNLSAIGFAACFALSDSQRSRLS